MQIPISSYHNSNFGSGLTQCNVSHRMINLEFCILCKQKHHSTHVKEQNRAVVNGISLFPATRPRPAEIASVKLASAAMRGSPPRRTSCCSPMPEKTKLPSPQPRSKKYKQHFIYNLRKTFTFYSCKFYFV